jgi:outer membrane protein
MWSISACLALAIGAFALASAPAKAQEGDEDRPDLRIRVGVGPQVQPEFPGARGYAVGPFFDIDIASGDELYRVEAPDDRFGLRLFTAGPLTIGPAADFQPARRERDVGAPVGRVDGTFEVGAFADYLLSDTLRLRGELLRGVNGHEGLVGSIGLDHIWRSGDRYALTLGPRLLLSDGRYQRAYYGVSSSAALASGLPGYRPGGGVHGVALAGGMSVQLDDRWGLFGYARGERLVRDAARSPIVRTFGSRNQGSAGLGLSYAFRIRR